MKTYIFTCRISNVIIVYFQSEMSNLPRSGDSFSNQIKVLIKIVAQ